MATATNRHKDAALLSAFVSTVLTADERMNVAATRSAAAANHFNCSRSSPDDRVNLTTTAATLTTRTAQMRMITAAITGVTAWAAELNGRDQKRAVYTARAAEVSVNAPPANHAAGSHRRERSRPVGKSRNTKASMAKAITQIQLDSQANARPAGKDPGATIRACSPYCCEKALSPSARPATRNSQPTRLAGRREARTKPVTGMARFTTSPKASEMFHLIMSAGTRCRSTYAHASPPAISATDTPAAQPATHRAVRTLIAIPPAPGFPLGARGPEDPPADHARPLDRVLARSAPLTRPAPPPLTCIVTCSVAPPAAEGQGGHPVRDSSCQHPCR